MLVFGGLADPFTQAPTSALRRSKETSSDPSLSVAPVGLRRASAAGRMIVRFRGPTETISSGADLLQADVAAFAERDADPQPGGAVVRAQLLGELGVQDEAASTGSSATGSKSSAASRSSIRIPITSSSK